MKNKLNILFILPNDSIGGAEKILKMVADYYSYNSNIKIFFLSKKKSKAWDDLICKKNVSVYYGQFNSIYLGLLNLFIFLFRNNEFDYSFSSQTLINGFLGLLIKLKIVCIKRFIGRESTTIFSRFKGLKLIKYKILIFLGYDKLDLLICQTDLMSEQFHQNLPNLSKKIKIKTIPNPFPELKKSDFNNVPDYPYIVSAGRLIPEKGFDLLINAFHILQKEFDDLKLVILGEGQLRDTLQKQIIELNLTTKVILYGSVNNVYSFFKQAKLCVVSSNVEGFPNVLLEMMSQNTSVVSTKCAGGIDQLKGVSLVEVNDLNSLVNILKTILKLDTSHNRKLFDQELKSRSINKFINNIELFLDE